MRLVFILATFSKSSKGMREGSHISENPYSDQFDEPSQETYFLFDCRRKRPALSTCLHKRLKYVMLLYLAGRWGSLNMPAE
jgi:hypothetical protein